MSKDKEKIKVTLTVTFQTEDGSDIGRINRNLEDDLIYNMERSIEKGMLTNGHDELLVDDYNIETQTVEE